MNTYGEFSGKFVTAFLDFTSVFHYTRVLFIIENYILTIYEINTKAN